ERRERRSIQRQPVHLRGDRRAPEAQLSHRPVDLPQAGLFADGGRRQACKPPPLLTQDLPPPVVDEPGRLPASRPATLQRADGQPPSFRARIARPSAGAICAGSSTGPSPYAPKARAIAANSTGVSSIRIPTTRFSTARCRARATSAW